MDPERPLFWHQGLFLQPQHFQLSDLFQASLVKPFYQYGLPYFWGIIDLRIQEAAFHNKSFEMIAGEFILPDGAHVAFPGNAVISPRSFDDSWLAAEKPFTVYLGLRKWNPAGGNVSVVKSLNEASEANTRFATAADPDALPDMHADGPSAQVKRLSFILRIFWETEKDQLDDYYLIPIAQLRRDGDLIHLDQRFVPPCLTAAASEHIIQILKDIRDQITSRCRQLEEYKNPKQATGTELDFGYMVFLLALRSLNRYVPLLQHVTETEHLHPWDLYGLLRQLIGELSTFSAGLSATGEREDGERVLPPYNHEDLFTCFQAARDLVAELLEAITVGPGQLLRLDFDGRFYSADISEAMLDRHNRFWLVLRTETEPEVVVEALRHVAKLSAKKNMTTLIARAVPGIPLEFYPIPPPGLPRRPHTLYFKIDQASYQWQDVANTRTIALFYDTAPADLVAEALILRS